MQNAEFRTLESIGASDVLLPIQYFGAMGDCGLRSEQRLMLAVLADAINVLQDRDPMAGARRRRSFAEAAEWVILKGTDDLFSFDSICDVLNIAPEWLREQLGGGALRRGAIGGGRRRYLRTHASNRMQKVTANRVR